VRHVPERLAVDPLTESTWYAEASARGLTLQEFLAAAVTELLSSEPESAEPARREYAGAGVPAVPSRSSW
jgi:hypothetical protein